MPDPDFDHADDQDGAEALDETNLTEDGEDIANFDTLDDVLDVTAAEGDEEDDADLARDADGLNPDELDEDDIGDAELGDELGDYEVDIGGAGVSSHDPDGEDAISPGSIEGLGIVADADTVEGGEDDFTNFEARSLSDEDLAELGYADSPQTIAEAKTEARLDEDLEDTFPASDPAPTRPGSD